MCHEAERSGAMCRTWWSGAVQPLPCLCSPCPAQAERLPPSLLTSLPCLAPSALPPSLLPACMDALQKRRGCIPATPLSFARGEWALFPKNKTYWQVLFASAKVCKSFAKPKKRRVVYSLSLCYLPTSSGCFLSISLSASFFHLLMGVFAFGFPCF